MILVTLEQLVVSMLSPLLLMVVLWVGPSAWALAYLQRHALAVAHPWWTFVALVPVLGPLAVMFGHWSQRAKPL